MPDTSSVSCPDPPAKMTDEEVTKLAKECVTNLVFMSDQVRRPEDVSLSFMILSLLPKEELDEFVKEGVAHFWEYHSKALPRGVNGYPCFLSCHTINITDYRRFQAEERRMRIALGEKL